MEPICMGCKKIPSELPEYSEAAADEKMNVNDYVREEEGTYNRQNGHFLCTSCYIVADMPTAGPGRRWVCP